MPSASASNDVVGRLVRLARERNQRDLEHGAERGLWFDEAAADRAVWFFSLLRHSKGEWAGKQFILAPWEAEITRTLFGWRRADGTRRFRIAYISTARKSGKSTWLAGCGNYLTVADHEPGAEVYSAATKRDQARIVHGEAVRMVKASPALRQRVQIFRDNISVLRTGSKYEPLGADADTCDGLNIHAALVDELHAHKTRAMWDILETGTGARRQPLIIAITTAGSDRSTICWELDDHAVQVLEGALEDDSFFAYIARIDKDDDWKDSACWVKANPNLGVTPKLDTLLEQAEKAKRSPAFLNTFLRLRLNQWTQQRTRVVDMDAWRECRAEIDLEALRGARCYAGLDLSSNTALSSVTLIFPVGQKVKIFTHSWLPADNIATRMKEDGVPYNQWAKMGLLTLTPGNVIDYEFIRAEILALRERFKILELAYDPWSAMETATKLAAQGLKMVEVRQGHKSLGEATKRLIGMILSKELQHDGNPLLTWCISNLAVRQDPNGNLAPDKAKATGRIDPVSAMINALSRLILQVKKPSPGITFI
jgi:phage terminase large subunit-like protein